MSAFRVYLRDSSDAIEVVTPGKSDAMEKVPLGFEKRDRIPRTPTKDEQEVGTDSTVDNADGLNSYPSSPSVKEIKDVKKPHNSIATIQPLAPKKRNLWCKMCIVS